MEEQVIFQWTFTPENYYEEEITINHQDFKIEFKKGEVLAFVTPEKYDSGQISVEKLQEIINNHFLGAQLVSYQNYELSGPSLTRLHPNGRKDVTVWVEPFAIKLSVHLADVQITNASGEVVTDTRTERIEKKKEFSALVEKHINKDKTLEHMIRSFSSARKDLDNELVHLYEIRDALVTRFGNQKVARGKLNITKSAWELLGRLANHEPIRQGRHRGEKIGKLRDATESELDAARKIARDMIEAYLTYIS